MSAPSFDLSVYGILDPTRAQGRCLGELAKQAIAGGVTFLQLRDKDGTTRNMVETARQILAVSKPHGVPLVINDRVDVALASGADGVHVGGDDMMPADVRHLMGSDAIVGVTIHSTEEADGAPVELSDYYGVGGIYVTASKNNPNPPIGIAGYEKIAAVLRERHTDCPIVAIAGIDASNAGPVIAAGADGVAVISALFMADDVTRAAADLVSIVAGARGEAA